MGNVLVHFCHDRMCRQIGDLCGRTGREIQQLLMESGLQWNFERGLISPAELHWQVQELVQQSIPVTELVQAASDIFELNEPIVPVLDSLRRQNYRLVLLSNTSVWHFEFIRDRFDVLDRFDAFVLSFEAGAIKPEPPIFEAALRTIHCEPQAAFYTDDIARYVEAGRTYGLHAEIFTDVPTLCGHLERLGVTVERMTTY
ncbi:HAD-IA family hydrolase [bacterium]|nr:HAD-IA family hydrolase [bacterium]